MDYDDVYALMEELDLSSTTSSYVSEDWDTFDIQEFLKEYSL